MKADTLVNTPSVKQWDVIAHLRPPPSHFPSSSSKVTILLTSNGIAEFCFLFLA